MEYFRYAVIVVHLFMVILAYGSVIHADIRILFRRVDLLTLKITQRIVTFGLVMLYITGITIVLIDYGHIPLYPEILHYPKLCIKVIAVLVLTINGIFLHSYVFKKLEKKHYISRKKDVIFTISGGLSMASWLFAVFAGTAKILVPILHIEDFALIYVGLICILVSGALIINNIFPINYKEYR